MQTILQIIQFENCILCSELNCWFCVSQALVLCLNIAHNKDTQNYLWYWSKLLAASVLGKCCRPKYYIRHDPRKYCHYKNSRHRRVLQMGSLALVVVHSFQRHQLRYHRDIDTQNYLQYWSKLLAARV